MSKPPEDFPEDADRTVYQPKGVVPPRNPSVPPATPAPESAPSATVPPQYIPPLPEPPIAAPPPPPPPRPAGSQQIADGAVLNGIYRITRFIAKGGMGEVYEAVNVHQPDDRVAVKVMLQHLAEDELVAAMFAKEAATLTRLNHEAIVQYRLAARDSEGRPYIVTEFIDGPNLEDLLGKLTLSDAEFLAICQKLAAGLGTAHTLGAIHRDIAPDNILLASGDPGRPKIIDFGIAKDAREHSGTIVGDGFAGKLRYVAPEQLGEYGRNIGPWTDMYSLALTLRAVVAGKPSDMGGSMADAVRKRMGVPDLADIPAPFRAAFEAALQPDPARRPQSMAEFNVMLTTGAINAGVVPDAGGAFGATTQLVPGQAATAPAGQAPGESAASLSSANGGKNRLPLLIGGGAAALIGVVGLVIAMSLGGGDTGETTPAAPTGDKQAAAPAAQTAAAAPGSPEFAALVMQASAGIGCSWLTLADAGGTAARFTGAASVPASVQTQLSQALAGAGAKVPTMDFASVLTLPQSNCAAIDALRAARGGSVRIATPQTTYELRNEARELDGVVRPPEPHAKVRLQVTGAAQHVALVFLSDQADPQIFDSAKTRSSVERYKGTQTPDGLAFTLPWTLVNGRPENAGIAVISSDQPLPANISTYDAGWPQRFLEGAKAGRWKADAVWFRVEDRVPG
jgi:serine/threonine-protein kinase